MTTLLPTDLSGQVMLPHLTLARLDLSQVPTSVASGLGRFALPTRDSRGDIVDWVLDPTLALMSGEVGVGHRFAQWRSQWAHDELTVPVGLIAVPDTIDPFTTAWREGRVVPAAQVREFGSAMQRWASRPDVTVTTVHRRNSDASPVSAFYATADNETVVAHVGDAQAILTDAGLVFDHHDQRRAVGSWVSSAEHTWLAPPLPLDATEGERLTAALLSQWIVDHDGLTDGYREVVAGLPGVTVDDLSRVLPTALEMDSPESQLAWYLSAGRGVVRTRQDAPTAVAQPVQWMTASHTPVSVSTL